MNINIILNEEVLKFINEIGEGNAQSYLFTLSKMRNNLYEYHFTTEDNDEYEVNMAESNNGEWHMEFGLKGVSNFAYTLNKGKLHKIMSTIIVIVNDFFNKTNFDILIIDPTDDKRKNLYAKYIEKHIPNDYHIEYSDNLIGIVKNNLTNEMYNLPDDSSNSPLANYGDRIRSIG